jgi:regulator of sigma E protease
VENWFDVIETLKANTGKDVKLSWDYEGRTSSGTLSVPKDSAWQSDVSYAMDFVTYPLNTVVKGKNPVAAFVLGIHQTWYLIKSTYVMLQRVAITQTVGVKNLSGPIYIINQGREVAEAGFNKLLYYLAMISANIAVINFLPIPVVDGGLMIILILEKIRGRSMSPRSTAVWQTVGLSLIVCLFLFVTYNDIARLIRGQ